eukprot:m.36252 g.36252  ORF g.36252 m.36252 type:complete len:298 (+) comp7548_c0_seq2:335-1228(+)
MATSYSWSYKADERPTHENPHGGKRGAGAISTSDWEPESLPPMAPATSEHREKRVRTNPAARIWVGGIPPEADLHDLGSFFGCFGKVLDINLIKDKHTGERRGFGFISYAEESEALKAQNYARLGDPKIKGAKIFIDFANKRRKWQSEEEEPEPTTEDKMRAVGLQWEYKWVSPEEMAAFKARQAEQSEHKALTDGSQPAAGAAGGVPVIPPDEYPDEAADSDVTQTAKPEIEIVPDDAPKAAPPAGPPPIIYGPFPTQNMIEWTEAGFFSYNPCFVRQLGEAEWDDVTELDFSLFP